MFYNGENPILKAEFAARAHIKSGKFNITSREYAGLAFRISGSTVLKYDDKVFTIKPNDVAYFPQKKGYVSEYTDSDFIVFHFSTLHIDSDVEVYSLRNHEKIYKMFLKAQKICEDNEPSQNLQLMAQLYEILAAVHEGVTQTDMPPYFLKAVSYINANYKDSKLSISSVCSMAGISETVFRQNFKRYYQKTPMDYVVDLRLDYARNLIISGASIEYAAVASGFNDSKYFARVVKKKLGCTPRQLRE